MSRVFTVRKEPEVEGFIANLAAVPRAQIESDFRKLESRGVGARAPLVEHIKGPIWELRSKVGSDIYRTFYFRSGENTFHAFYIHLKKSQKLPSLVKRRVFQKYQQITGEKP